MLFSYYMQGENIMNTIKLSVMTFGLAAASVFAQDTATDSTKKAEPAVDKKGLEFNISGRAEFDVYADASTGSNQKLYHDYKSRLNLIFQTMFNENWSAQVEVEGNADFESPTIDYKGAFVQYKQGDDFAIKFGDLAYSEGAFSYYYHNDSALYAAGMREHQIRGIELDYKGLQLGVGFGRGVDNDVSCWSSETFDCSDNRQSYDIHLAYQFDLLGQMFRPYIHYKSWQKKDANMLHAGLHTDLILGPFDIHAVYGLHADRLKKSLPNATHAFLGEPTLKLGRVTVKAGAFFAIIDDDPEKATIHTTFDDYEIPEYKFAYGEVDLKVLEAFTVGFTTEWHTNTLDNTKDLGTLEFGPRFYFTPFKNLDVTASASAIIPTGDDWTKVNHDKWVSTYDYKGKDTNFYFEFETVFKF